ncbi:GNAT family N-acetyltransferase [Arthrobacter agilis]|uniref:GNAT family N-acetyltransferase n=1 Tax=Arthrobacter agilis TaxID=37921 RepID=UPI0027849E05|nr:GNAT family protein [Arthrobacter agilis]MDQ0734686.1 RimJ/RimL family protein N-acetyltransferase [Arthrobacter agilis]
MSINLVRLDAVGNDHEALVNFMTRNEFRFHGTPRITRQAIEASIAKGAYRNEDNDSFWIDHAEHGRIGIARVQDLRDPTAMFDLRLDEEFRGRGLGLDSLRALTQHVFSTLPDTHRFEGQTREDNIAMRKTFLRCGWAKEAHYREGWPVQGGTPVASVAYSILRRDWETGQTTTFVWEDLTL